MNDTHVNVSSIRRSTVNGLIIWLGVVGLIGIHSIHVTPEVTSSRQMWLLLLAGLTERASLKENSLILLLKPGIYLLVWTVVEHFLGVWSEKLQICTVGQETWCRSAPPDRTDQERVSLRAPRDVNPLQFSADNGPAALHSPACCLWSRNVTRMSEDIFVDQQWIHYDKVRLWSASYTDGGGAHVQTVFAAVPKRSHSENPWITQRSQ